MNWTRMGAGFMTVAILMGAFGAHALKARLTADAQLDVYKTAVLYHLIHGLALFVVAWLSQSSNHSNLSLAGWLFMAGIVLFSGSLYALSMTGVRWLGAITPLGGLCFIAGWFLIAVAKLGKG